MNHYPHHIGDFNSATRHLTFVERALYRELLDLYYDTERPLLADATKLARRVLAHTDEQREALQAVLQEFFVQEDDGWHNARCDREIAAYRERIEQQSRAGRASAEKRAQRMPGDGDGVGTVGAGARKAPNKQATDVARPFNDRSTNQNQNQNQLIPPTPLQGADAVDAAPGRAGGGWGRQGRGRVSRRPASHPGCVRSSPISGAPGCPRWPSSSHRLRLMARSRLSSCCRLLRSRQTGLAWKGARPAHRCCDGCVNSDGWTWQRTRAKQAACPTTGARHAVASRPWVCALGLGHGTRTRTSCSPRTNVGWSRPMRHRSGWGFQRDPARERAPSRCTPPSRVLPAESQCG